MTDKLPLVNQLLASDREMFQDSFESLKENFSEALGKFIIDSSTYHDQIFDTVKENFSKKFWKGF